jgi:predicted transcriptional regulator
VDRAELGALRDAIDTILNWPDSVRDQIAQWLQTDASKPKGADPGQLFHSRSNRRRGFMPSAEESAARERALLEAMRDDSEAGVVQWAKTTRCDKSAVSMRLGRLAKRGVVQRDGNGRWRLAGVNPTTTPSL